MLYFPSLSLPCKSNEIVLRVINFTPLYGAHKISHSIPPYLIVPHSEAVPPLVMLLLLEAIVVRSRLEILLTLPITVVVKLPPLLWAFLVINRGTPVATLVLLLVVLLLVVLLLLSVSVSVVKSPLPWEHILGLCRVVVSLVGTGSTVPLLLWGAKAQRQEAAVRAGV